MAVVSEPDTSETELRVGDNPSSGLEKVVLSGSAERGDGDGDTPLPPLPPVEDRPGTRDRLHFTLDPSVDNWASWTPRLADTLVDDPARGLAASLERLQRAGATESPQAAAYWAYHSARMTFFLLQGLVSLGAMQLGGTDPQKAGINLSLDLKTSPGTANLVEETMKMFKDDVARIGRGDYPYPWDMTTPLHRQSNPRFVLRQGLRYVREATGVLGRKSENQAEPLWLDSTVVPEYYRNTFHYQTDGWMSSGSAQVYESSTETLFLGRQDAMQRLSLGPIVRHARDLGRPDGKGVKMLEVGCGTGRFATFVRDALPQIEATLVDLSPFYLEQARDNHAYWERRRTMRTNSGSSASSSSRSSPSLVTEVLSQLSPFPTEPMTNDAPKVKFVQAAAESLPFDDETYDVVSSTYMLHEVPLPVRKQFLAHAARVLKPGGTLVINDSIQLGDRPQRDPYIGNFGDFNEPWYRCYTRTDLGALGKEVGLVPGTKLLGSASKCLTFTKPMATTTED